MLTDAENADALKIRPIVMAQVVIILMGFMFFSKRNVFLMVKDGLSAWFSNPYDFYDQKIVWEEFGKTAYSQSGSSSS
jgi:hypothetical protein